MNLKRFEAKKKIKATEIDSFANNILKQSREPLKIDSFANNILFVNLPSLWTDHYRPWVD